MASDIQELRDLLFETMRGLRDGTLSPETAAGINKVASTLVDTAKVEVDFLRVNQGGNSNFIDPPPPGVTRHRALGSKS